MSGMEAQIQEKDYFIIKGKIFEKNPGKKIQSFGITSKKINEFETGEIAILKTKAKLRLMKMGIIYGNH